VARDGFVVAPSRLASWSVLLLALLFQLRPGEDELRVQVLEPARAARRRGAARSDELPFWDMAEAFARVARSRSGALAPLDVSGHLVRDYYVATVASKPEKRADLRYVGVLGVWMPWRDKDDLLLLATLMFAVYGLHARWPGPVYRACVPRLANPLWLVASSLFCDSLMTLLMVGATLFNMGPMLQDAVGRGPFLAAFFGAGVLAGLDELTNRRYPRPAGGVPGAFALLVHGTLLFPGTRYSLYGMELSGAGLIGVQMLMPLLSGGGSLPMVLDRAAQQAAGLAVGLASFCFFSEPKAAILLLRWGIPVGADKPPSSLALPIMGIYWMGSQLLAPYLAID
jgi:hypothetical protein